MKPPLGQLGKVRPSPGGTPHAGSQPSTQASQDALDGRSSPCPPCLSLGSATAQSARVLFDRPESKRAGICSEFYRNSNQKHLEIQGTKLDASGQSSSSARLGIHSLYELESLASFPAASSVKWPSLLPSLPPSLPSTEHGTLLSFSRSLNLLSLPWSSPCHVP